MPLSQFILLKSNGVNGDKVTGHINFSVSHVAFDGQDAPSLGLLFARGTTHHGPAP